METLVKEKILEQFVKEVPRESATIQPINVDIKSTDVTRMTTINTMKSNDGNYFIRYGGFVTSSSYNAIEVYSVNSLDNNAAIYVFDNLQIDNHTFFIQKMKQSEDGRFYAVAQYNDGSNRTNYLIIFNNFIQDGYCQINKYYTGSNIGTSDSYFYDVTKVKDAGVYFILTESHLIRFEINILEGNKTNIATIVNGGTITSGSYQPQLNILKDKLILTKLWNVDVTPSGEPPYTKYEYTKAVVNINEELPNTITLNQLYTTNIQTDIFINGAVNQPFEAIIPYLVSGFNPGFVRVRIDGTVVSVADRETQILNKVDPYFCIQEELAALSNNGQLYLFYFKEDKTQMYNFYTTSFSKYFSQYEVIRQYDMITLIGSANLGTQQSIVSIKNIYSINTTSLPYYTDMFCLPAYMNLYSDSNDNTSLIFSRDATARFYSGNQVTSTFIVPNYLLNDGNIEKASVYGKTNYLLNDTIKDYEKNRFESLYFNFIYNLNVIDNTNGLNSLNQTGSNRIADTLWKSFIPMFSRLSKARITYEDLSTEIINLNLVSLIGGTATFNYQVSGNIVKIEYLSEDEKTVYSTYRGQITGNHTITQVVKIIPNETATLSGTSIYISDSSNLTFANIQINGNSVQNGTPTTSSPIAIKNAGGIINYFNKETILAKHLINSNGTITEDNYNFVSDYIEVDSNSKYTISAATNRAKRIAYYDDSQTFISRPVVSNYSGTVTTPSNAKYVRLSCHNDDLDSLQFEKGSFVSSYVPYYNRMAKITEIISNSDNTQSQEFTIPCQEPMRSIGNARDVFVKQDGIWYEKHNLGEVILNGTETWYMTNDGNFKRFSISINTLEKFTSRKSNLLSDHYVGNTTSGIGHMFSYDGYVYLYPTSDITSVDSFKAWLSNNNTTVVYVLETPNYIECTQEQIEALESIIRAYTYEPITNINSTDETPAYLNVTYYKQL